MTELSDFLQERLYTLVWSGLYSREQILEDLAETVEGEDENVSAEAQRNIVDAQLSTKRRAELAWPQTTDCLRLDEAFEQLKNENIVALQNAGYTQSDGYEDCYSAFEALGGDSSQTLGFCFYHFQDLERAVRGHKFHLGFGSFRRGDDSEAVRVGIAVCDALIAKGLAVEWSRSPNERICIVNFDWKRRSC